MYIRMFTIAFLVVVLSLSSGCSSTQIRPITLPKPFKPSGDSVHWLKDFDAPDYVVNDFIDCTALGEIIRQTSNKDAINRKEWHWSMILDYASSSVKNLFNWLFGLFI